MKISLLGPEGTFSHFVALALFPKAELLFAETISDAFIRLKEATVDYVIAPLVNSQSGFVEQTIEHIVTDPLCVLGKRLLNLSFALVGNEASSTLFCYPQTFASCKLSIQKLCPHCDVAFTSSNEESAKQAKEQNALAIIPKFALQVYPLPVVAQDVQDTVDNQTAFLLFGREGGSIDEPKQTLFCLSKCTEDVTESSIKELFSRSAIKIKEIHSLFIYDAEEEIYLIECFGNYRDPTFEEVLQELAEMCSVKVLGAYGEAAI